MKTIWLILVISSLLLMLLPGILVFKEVIRLEESHPLMLVGALLWLLSRWGWEKAKQARESDP